LTKLRKATAAAEAAEEKASAERERRERKTGVVGRSSVVPGMAFSQNEPNAPASVEGSPGPQGVVAAPETVVSGSL
jgi:hypothetical protein